MAVGRERVEATLLELLQIPSYSAEERDIADHLTGVLQSMGAEVSEDATADVIGGTAGNLLATLPGNVDAPPIFLNAHIDTVQPTRGLKLVLGDGFVRSDGTTILGADDKAGVTAILEGVKAVLASGAPCPPLELVFTVSEETGLEGAKEFDMSRLRAAHGFVFDGGSDLGELTVSAPHLHRYKIEIEGLAAHAGVEPDNGRNAIAAAAFGIVAVSQGRVDDRTTCNLGKIEGGQATNIIAPSCSIDAEIRSRELPRLREHEAHVRSCFEQAAYRTGCTVTMEQVEASPGFVVADDEPVLQLALEAMRRVGQTPHVRHGLGGSDANIFNAAGKRCVLLPCGERDPHTNRESVRVDDVLTAAEMVVQLIGLAAG